MHSRRLVTVDIMVELDKEKVMIDLQFASDEQVAIPLEELAKCLGINMTSLGRCLPENN